MHLEYIVGGYLENVGGGALINWLSSTTRQVRTCINKVRPLANVVRR